MTTRKLKVNVQSQEIGINIREAGDGGPPVLMVHGIPTNALLWRHVQAHMKDRYQTFAMDMIGYGESDMPLDRLDHTLSHQAEAVKQVIEGLGVEGKVTLVAHDHGGGVAQIVASRYPDHVHRLVLINPISFDYWPVLEVEGLGGLKGAPDEVLSAAMAQAAGNFGILMRMGSYTKTPFYDKAVKENYLGFWARGPGLTGFKSLIAIAADPTNDETMAVDHASITSPTMILWAMADCFMPVEAAHRLKAAIAGPVRLEYIERAGHWCQEDRPEHIADRIDDFITEWQKIEI